MRFHLRSAFVALLLCLLALKPFAQAAEVYVQQSLLWQGVTISAIAFSEDGTRIAFASDESIVSIRDTSNNEEVRSLMWTGKKTGAMVFSPDGSRLALISYNKDLSLWDVNSGQVLKEGSATVPLASIAFSPDGSQLLAPGQDGKLHLFDAATLSETRTVATEGALILDGSFSPDGKRIASVDTKMAARVFDPSTGRELLQLSHDEPLESARFSGDGALLATAGRNGQVKIFDAKTGVERLSIQAGDGDVNAIAFSPDGSRLAAAFDDDAIGIWEVATGNPVVTLKGTMGEVTSVRFGTDGKTLYSKSGGAIGQIWRISTPAAAGDTSAFAGLWLQSFDLPEGETLPPEVAQALCQVPIKVQRNGLVVFYEFFPPDAPRVSQHFRCGPDLSCQSFAGEPAQGLEVLGTATLKEDKGKLSLCGSGECLVLERCEGPRWSAEEIQAGYDKIWEQAMGKVWD